MKKCTIKIETSPTPEDVAAVMHGLNDYNVSQAGDANFQYLKIFMRNESGRVVGGLFGETFWEWLHVDILWVAGSVRGMGYGSRLIAVAENEAIRRGCKHAYLDTFSFQARPFYEGLGYEPFGALNDYPTGHTRIFMRKTLLPA